jgi:hypothetical protein
MVADNGIGDVVYLHILGVGLVFLNSPDAAFDLLDNPRNLKRLLKMEKKKKVSIYQECVLDIFFTIG